jgi:hypothetical protein
LDSIKDALDQVLAGRPIEEVFANHKKKPQDQEAKQSPKQSDNLGSIKRESK